MAFPVRPENENSEWLEADGLGGFASGTISGIRTRRYHALLLAATVATRRSHGPRQRLRRGTRYRFRSGRSPTQRYSPGVDTPDGLTRLESFDTGPWPQWTYAVPGGKIIHELFVPKDRAAVVLRWRWEGVRNPMLRLYVRPFFSGRDFHSTHHENPAFRFTPAASHEGEVWHFYDGVPEVAASSNGIYHHEPAWYRNFQYDEELARGLDAVEDLAAPGRYEFNLGAGPAVLIFSAKGLGLPLPSLSPIRLADKLAAANEPAARHSPTPRLRAGDAYSVKRGSGKTIIAGYPWFGDWGRDTFIAMRGLCLASGRLAEARDILLAWAETVSEGMLPNRFPDRGGQPEYNSVDASLWYVIVVHEFLQAVGDDPKKELLLATVNAILTGYRNGTRYGIRADADGLLACGVPGMQLTWMDTKFTPRIGKPVEVQALWLNALSLSGGKWKSTFDQGRASFEKRFWNEARGCLYDVVDADVDDRLRPNQIFAVGGLPLALLTGKRAASVVQVVEDQLWTPMGLRSLAPGEKEYAPRYEGGPSQRDASYHQGTVWPWLTGPFVEAWVRVHGDKAKARELFLAPRLASLAHVPELADAEAPNAPKGCPFQAWSVGELLRLEHKVL